MTGSHRESASAFTDDENSTLDHALPTGHIEAPARQPSLGECSPMASKVYFALRRYADDRSPVRQTLPPRHQQENCVSGH